MIANYVFKIKLEHIQVNEPKNTYILLMYSQIASNYRIRKNLAFDFKIS